MTVELFKRKNVYKDKDGNEKTGVNFSLKCGDILVPIEVRYFGKDDKPDTQYASRKTLLSAFAEELPEREEKPEVKAEGTNANGSLPF